MASSALIICAIVGCAFWLLGITVITIALCRAAKRGDRGLTQADDQAADLAKEFGIADAEARRLLNMQNKLNAMRSLSERSGRGRYRGI